MTGFSTTRAAKEKTAQALGGAGGTTRSLSGFLLTQDPIGLAGGVNLYAYAGNNPVAFSDPFGLCKKYEDGSEDPDCRKLINDLRATAEQADKQLAAGAINRFRQAADAFEQTDREVMFVDPLDRVLNHRGENSDSDPRTFAAGRTRDSDIRIGNVMGEGSMLATATHEILVHGPERVSYVGDIFASTDALNHEIYRQLPAHLRASAGVFRLLLK
jgi:uncharacterized protein RhaS with RHS repeats